jgi:hypothetical protein
VSRPDGNPSVRSHFGVHWLLIVVIAAFFHAVRLPAAPAPDRPLSARGDAARTLVIYSAARAAYSLGNELEALKLQLNRVATRLETVPTDQVTSNQLAAAHYVVVFCPQPEPKVGTNLLAALAPTNRPVLWIAHGVGQLVNFPSLAGQFEMAPAAPGILEKVTYRDRQWPMAGEYWIPTRLTPNSTARPLIRPAPANQSSQLALAWKIRNVTIFSAVPTAGPLSFVFSDLLLDFYGVTHVSANRLFFRIDDYEAASNHREFKRLADYLASRGHPFILSVAPAWKNPASGQAEDLDAAPDFVAGLRHAQARGGRIILRGARRESNGHGEFWNLELDRPPDGENPGGIREGITRAATLLIKHGLLPLAWQTPDNAASGVAYAEIARVFSTAVDRPQLSNLTHLEKALLPALTVDRFGRQIVPENLGYVPGGAAGNLEAIQSRAEFLSRLRGTTSGCFIHAYQPLEKVMGLVETLEGLNVPFLDLAALDNRVHVPGHVLLTGRAQCRVTLAGGIVTWTGFDRTGRMIATEQEFAVAGERTLQRKGRGDIELFEFRETIP